MAERERERAVQELRLVKTSNTNLIYKMVQIFEIIF